MMDPNKNGSVYDKERYTLTNLTIYEIKINGNSPLALINFLFLIIGESYHLEGLPTCPKPEKWIGPSEKSVIGIVGSVSVF